MTLGPQGIEWEITQVGITTGKSSLPLCLGRGRTHRETDRKSHTHSRKQGYARHTARPSGSGGELSAQKAPVKTGRRRHTRNSSKWRRFNSPAGTVGERGVGGLGSCAFPWCNAWLVVSRRRWSGGFGDWEGQLSSLSAGSGSGRTGACRHFREAFSQEIRLPPVLSFQRDNVQAFLRPGGGLARWPTTVGVRPVLTRLGASRTKLENAVKASVFPTKLHFPSAPIQHPTHKLTPGICCLLLFLLLCLLRRLFFKELLMTHSNQV